MSLYRNQVRIAQTADQFTELQKRIRLWLSPRRKNSAYEAHHSQLETLAQFLEATLGDLRARIADLSAADATTAIYEQCRLYDHRLIWIDRVWRFFADKFDQREDAAMRPVLLAADEIVWSCFAGIFQKAGKARPTLPLPYIEPFYSPRAVPRDDPDSLRDPAVGDSFFREFLRELPIPLISLPPSAVRAPWWLIYLAHEVGHHIQHDMLSDFRLVGEFGSALKTAAGQSAPPPYPAGKWQQWGQEIFADTFSLYMTGPWALRAMTELETAAPDAMLMEKFGKTSYPAPVIRLALMQAMLTAIGVSDEKALQGFDAQPILTGEPLMHGPINLRDVANQHYQMISSISKTIAEFPFGELNKTFHALCELRTPEFKPGGKVYAWTRGLLGKAPLNITADRLAPRYLISSGMLAWTEITATADSAQQAALLETLRDTLLEKIPASREPGTRSAEDAAHKPDVDALRNRFTSLLMETRPETLAAGLTRRQSGGDGS